MLVDAKQYTDFTGQDRFAYPYAMEAISGLLAQGKKVNEGTVHDWLEVVLTENGKYDMPTMARAMYFAKRVIDGPMKRK